MPLPSHALTLHGGCNCRALRYRINIPALHNRPLHPNNDPPPSSSSTLKPIRLPYTFTDQCNDCRRSTGSILPTWITVDISTIEASLLPRSLIRGLGIGEVGGSIQRAERDQAPTFHTPGSEIFTSAGVKRKDNPLSYYNSSSAVTRTFCSICGTPVSYWDREAPGRMDIVYGTLDREYLDSEEGEPERHMWWGLGLGWMKRWIAAGAPEAERHESDKLGDRENVRNGKDVG